MPLMKGYDLNVELSNKTPAELVDIYNASIQYQHEGGKPNVLLDFAEKQYGNGIGIHIDCVVEIILKFLAQKYIQSIQPPIQSTEHVGCVEPSEVW